METRRAIVALMTIAMMLAIPLAAAGGPAGRPSGRQAGPDIRVRPDSYGSNPLNPTVGDEVQSNFTIENIGDVDVTTPFEVAFFLNDTSTPIKIEENNFTFGMLAASDSYNVSVWWPTFDKVAGINYTVILVVDTKGEVAESDEGNNEASHNITLAPRLYPDLSITPEEIWLSPSPPKAGDSVNITATVRNSGEKDVRFADVFFYLNDTSSPISTFETLRDVNVSEGRNASAVWDTSGLSPGNYTILICVNPPWSPNRAVENNYTNNNLSLPVVLGVPRLDLAARYASWMPDKPKVGQALVITVEVVNVGEAATPPCNLSLYADTDIDPAAEAPVQALLPEEVSDVMLVWNTSGIFPGIHRMRAVVDSGFDLSDSNRSNNTFIWTLNFTAEVDLSLDRLNISPDAPRLGDTVKFSVRVVNLGGLRCNSANLTLKVRGKEADQKMLLTLAGGGELNCSLKWTTAGLFSGSYDYEVRVAAGPGDNDSDPANNLLIGQLELLPPVPRSDLRVRAIRIAEWPRQGDSLTIGIDIENVGDLEANASSVMVKLESSRGAFYFTDAPWFVPPVPAGGTATVNVTGDTSRFSADRYSLNATVDFKNEISESNESNNHLSAELQILSPLPKLPSLGVSKIDFIGVLEEDQRLDILVTINNTGQANALNVTVTFLIDGVVSGTQSVDVIEKQNSRNITLSWTFPPGNHTVQVRVSTQGLSDVVGTNTVEIRRAPSEGFPLLLAVGLGIILLLVAAVMIRALRQARRPGPRVRLVEEAEEEEEPGEGADEKTVHPPAPEDAKDKTIVARAGEEAEGKTAIAKAMGDAEGKTALPKAGENAKEPQTKAETAPPTTAGKEK